MVGVSKVRLVCEDSLLFGDQGNVLADGVGGSKNSSCTDVSFFSKYLAQNSLRFIDDSLELGVDFLGVLLDKFRPTF